MWHRHKWVTTAVTHLHRTSGGNLAAAGAGAKPVTVKLLTCTSCTDNCTEELNGHWTLHDVTGHHPTRGGDQ